MLTMHVLNQRGESTWATPSGWTPIASQRNGHAAFYKIAVGGETTVNVTKTGTTGKCIGTMMLFRGESGATLSIDASTSDVDLTVPTCTPTKAGTLWVWYAGRSTDSTDFSAYAMTTDDPGSWTERYENDAAGQCSLAAATSAVRSQTSATGDLTASGTGADSGIVFAIAQVASASPAVSTLTLTASQPASTITTNSNVPVAAITMTAAQPAPAITTQEFALWYGTAKNAATLDGTAKNAATLDNPSKTSASLTNPDKTQ